jgi:hypothetical protein
MMGLKNPNLARPGIGNWAIVPLAAGLMVFLASCQTEPPGACVVVVEHDDIGALPIAVIARKFQGASQTLGQLARDAFVVDAEGDVVGGQDTVVAPGNRVAVTGLLEPECPEGAEFVSVGALFEEGL